MSLEALRKLKSRALNRDGFWIEKVKLEFTRALRSQMQRRNVKKGSLARKLDLSPAYISKVMRGDENLTIETMVKLARGAGGRLHLHISDQNSDVNWIECNSGHSFREFMSSFGGEQEYTFERQKASVLRSGGSLERGDVAA